MYGRPLRVPRIPDVVARFTPLKGHKSARAIGSGQARLALPLFDLGFFVPPDRPATEPPAFSVRKQHVNVMAPAIATAAAPATTPQKNPLSSLAMVAF